MTIKINKLEHPMIISAEDDNYVLEIGYDEHAESPRQWDNLGTIISWHRRYEFTDANCVAASGWRKRNTWSWEEFEEWWNDGHAGIRLPIYMLDHSGLSVSTKPFGCRFDSGLLGWIYITCDVLTDIIERRKNDGDTEEFVRKEMEHHLHNEVEALDRFLRGEIYCYSVKKKSRCNSCNHVELDTEDGCSGYFSIEDIGSEISSSYRHLFEAIKKEGL